MKITGNEAWVRKVLPKLKRTHRPQKLSEHEETLWQLLKRDRIDQHFARQVKWHPDRRWTADFASARFSILIEIDGQTWSKGAHTYGHGYDRDREKDCEAQLRGWLVLRFSGGQVANGYALDTIVRAINYRTAQEAS